MRCKKLLSITAFFAAFVFSAAFAGLFIDDSATSTAYFNHNHTHCFHLQYDTVTADAIDDLLRRDINNGETRFRQLSDIDDTFNPPFGTSSMDDYANIVEQYADESSNMDDGNLPRDVRQAWRTHMRAWKGYAEFLKVSDNLNYSDEELKIKDLQYGNEINRTWYNLLRISRTYGSYISN